MWKCQIYSSQRSAWCYLTVRAVSIWLFNLWFKMNWDVWCFQCIPKDACCREYLQHSESSANVLKLCCILEFCFLHLFHLSVCLCLCTNTISYLLLYCRKPVTFLFKNTYINIFSTCINTFLCDDQIGVVTMHMWDFINIRLFFSSFQILCEICFY